MLLLVDQTALIQPDLNQSRPVYLLYTFPSALQRTQCQGEPGSCPTTQTTSHYHQRQNKLVINGSKPSTHLGSLSICTESRLLVAHFSV